MSDRFGPNSLSATRHFVLVLRLVLGPSEREVYGEVIDPETGDCDPFVGLTNLSAAVEEWLRRTDRHRQDMNEPERTPPRPESGES